MNRILTPRDDFTPITVISKSHLVFYLLILKYSVQLRDSHRAFYACYCSINKEKSSNKNSALRAGAILINPKWLFTDFSYYTSTNGLTTFANSKV